VTQHQRFREWLAYRSELSPNEERQLEEHLARCVECRRSAEGYARQVQLLRALPDITPPRTLGLGVIHQAHQPRPPSRWSFGRPAWGALTLGFGLLVVLAAVGLLQRPHDRSRSAMQHPVTIITSSSFGNRPTPPSRRTPTPGKSSVRVRQSAHHSIQPASAPKTSPLPVQSQAPSNASVPTPTQPFANSPLNGSASVLSQALAATPTPPLVENTAMPSRRTVASPVPPASSSIHRRTAASKTPARVSAPPSPIPTTPAPLFSVEPSTSAPTPNPTFSPVPQETASPPVVRRTIVAGQRPTPPAPIGAVVPAATTPTASPIKGPAVSAVPSSTATFPSASISAPIASPSPSATPMP